MIIEYKGQKKVNPRYVVTIDRRKRKGKFEIIFYLSRFFPRTVTWSFNDIMEQETAWAELSLTDFEKSQRKLVGSMHDLSGFIGDQTNISKSYTGRSCVICNEGLTPNETTICANCERTKK